MVKIRLSQTGSTNRKTYRLIAIDESKRRDGRALEILGFYNPLVKPPQVSIKRDRVEYWLKVGAQMTGTAKKIVDQSAT